VSQEQHQARTSRSASAAASTTWTANASFIADGDGRVDLTRMAPVNGSYKGVDAMRLFWSAERVRTSSEHAAADEDESSRAEPP
jgi:hypothetical protein